MAKKEEQVEHPRPPTPAPSLPNRSLVTIINITEEKEEKRKCCLNKNKIRYTLLYSKVL